MPADILEKAAKVEDVVSEISNIKSGFSDAVEGGLRSARQAMKHASYAAEDVLEEAEHSIKQRPWETVGISFAAGLLIGTCLTWLGLRRR
jgi:ElaB/YqjD/DUF883 family membrane-anchored ribosome-binding protein